MSGIASRDSASYSGHSGAAETGERLGSLAPPSTRPKTQALLCVVEGNDQGALFPLHGTSSWLGRKLEAPICLSDEAISLQHAQVYRRVDGRHYIEDASSLNGTFVNETRVTEPVLLEDGDRIRLGDTILRFAMLEANQQQALLQLMEVGELEPFSVAYNRRYLATQLRREVATASRARQELALLLVDIDHLRSINAAYSHAVGDEVVGLVGRMIRRLSRPSDLLCRYHGGEFLIVARGTSRRNAEILAHRIARNVHELPLPDDQVAPVSVSIGITCWEPATPSPDGLALLESAEAALFAAKAAGPSTVRRRNTEPPRGSCTIPLPHTVPPRCR